MKKYFYLFLCLTSSILLCAQVATEQDCLGAIPICKKIVLNTNSYTGVGNYINEINPSTSCLLSGEKNDVWYSLVVQQTGILNFTIIPIDSLNDYDWAIYDLTTKSCSGTYSILPVRCNYSPNISNKGCKGKTGPNNDTLVPCGNMNKPSLNVLSGSKYVINISNFSSNQAGYTIDFSMSTAIICDSTVLNGVEQFSDVKSFSIYPVPAKEELNMYFKDVFNGKIFIINTLGDIIQELTSVNEKEIQISTVNLNRGIYIIKCSSDDNVFANKIFIIE